MCFSSMNQTGKASVDLIVAITGIWKRKLQCSSLTKVRPWHLREESSDRAHRKLLHKCPRSGTASCTTQWLVCLRSVWYRMTSTVRGMTSSRKTASSTPPPTTTMSDGGIIRPKLASVDHHLFKIKVLLFLRRSSVTIVVLFSFFFFMGHNEKTPLALQSRCARIE